MLTAISSKSLSKESNSQINIKPIQYIICILSLETSFTSLFRLCLETGGSSPAAICLASSMCILLILGLRYIFEIKKGVVFFSQL